MKKRIILSTMFIMLAAVMLNAQLKPGDIAPDFKLKGVDNKWVSLSDYKDQKGVILVFTCNHCPYAKLYETRIIDLQNKFGGKQFPVVAINPNDSTIVEADSFSNMVANAAAKGFNFPYLLDDIQLFKKYGATKTPHVFVLKNEGGSFKVAYIGAIDDNSQDPNDVGEAYVVDAVNALLEGKALARTETKAVGCTIKFK